MTEKEPLKTFESMVRKLSASIDESEDKLIKNDSLNETLEKRALKSIEDWNKKIHSEITTLELDDRKKLEKLEMRALIHEMDIDKEISSFLIFISKFKMIEKIVSRRKMEFYMTNQNFSFSGPQQRTMIESDLAFSKRTVMLLEMYVEHLRSLKDKCNRVHFMIKHKIALTELLGR